MAIDLVKGQTSNFENESMRRIVLKYYELVRHRLAETVPRLLRTILAIGIDEDIFRTLRDKWTTPNECEMQELFSEPSQIQNTRRELDGKIQTLKKAIDDIEQLERQLMKH